LILLLVFVIVPRVIGEEKRLVDRPPFDQVVLDEANQNATIEVAPLDFPGRRPPAQPSGSLKVEWLNKPGEPIEIPWKNIVRIRLYEEMLLDEARRLTAAGKFDDAFDYYARLVSDYPSLPGANDAANEFLRLNALQFYETGELDRALSVLAALYDRTPSAPGLNNAIDAVCGKMIEQRLRDQDYSAARAVLDLWQQKFAALKSTAATGWADRFATAAQRQVVDGRRLFDDGNYVAARKAIARALNIWPQHDEAIDLLAEIQRRNPSISVGVMEASPREPVRRIDDWAAMRTSRLVQPLLAELVDFSPEGGVYHSPYGRWVLDDTGLRLSLEISDEAARSGLSADYLARFLLRMADPSQPQYDADFAAQLAGTSVVGNRVVQIDWTRPHVRPEALLQVPLAPDEDRVAGDTASRWAGARKFELKESEPASTTFSALPALEGAGRSLTTIVEQVMPDDDAAIAALLNGEVDVLDRVPPWYVERLRAARDVRIGTYRLPTVHVLIPNPSRELPGAREFRRALCFGIQRSRIVQQVLLGGQSVTGFEVLSGPFPAGRSYSDPLRYAYNSQLTPRPFEPRLAAVLATVAWSAVLDPRGKGNVELTALPTLVLAHPSDPVARIACETIKLQLARVGISVDLLEFSADDLLAGAVEYDLRYAELAVWEPVVDVRRLVGPDGLAGGVDSAYLNAALRELDAATNWKDVRAKLSELHDIAHHDLPLVPLWQTVNHFAYRSTVRGIGRTPVTLYQNIDQWRIATGSSASGVEPAD
jgi:ABC-type transport system substrate-binding protein